MVYQACNNYLNPFVDIYPGAMLWFSFNPLLIFRVMLECSVISDVLMIVGNMENAHWTTLKNCHNALATRTGWGTIVLYLDLMKQVKLKLGT